MAFSSSAGAAIHVDTLGGATIGGTGVGEANTITGYDAGILVRGASTTAVIDQNTITGGGSGIVVDGSNALVQNAVDEAHGSSSSVKMSSVAQAKTRANVSASARLGS